MQDLCLWNTYHKLDHDRSEKQDLIPTSTLYVVVSPFAIRRNFVPQKQALEGTSVHTSSVILLSHSHFVLDLIRLSDVHIILVIGQWAVNGLGPLNVQRVVADDVEENTRLRRWIQATTKPRWQTLAQSPSFTTQRRRIYPSHPTPHVLTDHNVSHRRRVH
ncbi:hypothetical protein JAAARDRAFT_505987 [Jaapia argillacea MUCL 33604]|uniref:Uncharacterized protein n=1 Tax=Jaapia argillacea MUCL 33604 TaxID=933084 RepID=A0A067PKQ0_9AGAM|nr:hypothetical protein JAAARDRAFT_505987 [Jaapia argillacea MUCL 33604]